MFKFLKKAKNAAYCAGASVAVATSASAQATDGGEYIESAATNIALVTPLIATVAGIALGWQGVKLGRAWLGRAK